MRFSLLLVALLAAAFPVNAAVAASPSADVVNSTIPDVNDLNKTDVSIDDIKMELDKLDAMVVKIGECKEPSSRECWTKILDVLDRANKKEITTDDKHESIFSTIFHTVVTIASWEVPALAVAHWLVK